MIYRTAPFSITFNDPYPQFKGHAILWCWISHKQYEIHSFNEILIGTYTRPTQQCHLKWPWVTEQNIQWHEVSCGHCNSWASCSILQSMKSDYFKQHWMHAYTEDPDNTKSHCGFLTIFGIDNVQHIKWHCDLPSCLTCVFSIFRISRKYNYNQSWQHTQFPVDV